MKIFYGWVIVAVGIVVTCVGFGSMMSLAVFLQPMAEAMGWSRTAIATAALLNFLAMAAGAFMWGALSDRFGTRVVVVAGGALMGLGLVTASRATSLGWFQLSFGVLVGLAAGSLYAPMTSTTTRWFTRHRTLAVALVSAGLSFGATFMAPFARWLISTYDWRTAMLVLGDLVWLIVIPAALLVRNPPTTAVRVAASSSANGGPALTVGQALRTPQFAAIAFTHFACCAAHSGPIFHMVTNAIDHGVTAMAAATVFSVAGLASFSGKIVCGVVADRVGVKRTLVTGLALQAAAISLYLVTRELGGFYGVAVMFGFAYGGVMPLYAVVVREYFGERIMGAVFGGVSTVATLGMALGPVAGGWLYDGLGSYAWMFIASSAIGAGAVAVALTFRPPASVRHLAPAGGTA
ncbi:MAG: MFS transporter [Candidatus Rokubacteria bacterium]|nr:MFS transporter [Candidatus Rokubacteria bacterium]